MDGLHAPSGKKAPGQANYWMANLRQRTTGLPFTVFISQKDNYRHDLRVKVSLGPRVQADQMGSYGVRPFMYHGGLKLSAQDEKLLEQWVSANKQVLEEFWDGDIEYTEDAIERIVAV